MAKRFVVALIIVAALVNVYFRTPTIKRNNYLSQLIEEVSQRTLDSDRHYSAAISPIVKEDRKDNDQYDILTVYVDENDEMMGQLLILPDGIEEPFQLSVILFNISESEALFDAKAKKTPMPERLNNHKLMKPCMNEVELPVFKELGFRVENLTSISPVDEKYEYHNMGYCTKSSDLSDRYLEIDGKSSAMQKFKFEFGLRVMHLLYPETYSKGYDISSKTNLLYLFVVVLIAALAVGGYSYYFHLRKRQLFEKLSGDVELQTNLKSANVDEDADIEQFIIDDDEPEPAPIQKKKNSKVSFKNADDEEMSNLMKHQD